MPKPGTTLKEPPKKEGKKKPSPPAVDLPVVYPEEDVQMFARRTGKEPLYADGAKKFLGWEEEEERGQFGENYLFINPFNKKKVRCTYNANNRPFDLTTALKYLQTIMKRRWKFNLETIIIGRFGNVVSGQHRLIALVLAEYARLCEDVPEGEDESWKEHFARFWKDEPIYIETLVGTGVSEDPEVVQTLDNVRPRSLGDVFYTRTDLFKGYKPKDREGCCKVLDTAIKTLWKRTGANDSAFDKYSTHAEMNDLLDRHPKLLEAAKHIYDEDCAEGAIKRIYSPGMAAGLMYLMACSESDGEAYRSLEPPVEKDLSFSRWERASEFWVEVAKGKQLKAIFDAIHAVQTEEAPDDVKPWEKSAIFSNAWNVWVEGGKVTQEKIALSFTIKDSGRKMNDTPTVGGIDVGDRDKGQSAQEAQEEENEEAPKPKKLKKGEVSEIVPAHERKEEEPAMTATKEVEALKARFPEHNVIQRDDMGSLTAYGLDAEAIAKHTRTPYKRHQGTARIVLRAKDEEEIAEKLAGAGVPFVVVERGKKGWEVVAANPSISQKKAPAEKAETNGATVPSKKVVKKAAGPKK